MSIATDLITIAENTPKVYEAGKKDRDKIFWDTFITNRADYNNVFAYRWNDEIFTLDRKIQPTTANGMFRENQITDLQKFSELIDFSLCTNFDYCFYNNKLLKRIGVVDMRSCSKIMALPFFSCIALESIEEIILKDDGSQTFDRAFGNDPLLTELKISGVIGSDWNIKDSPLNKASFVSNINALSRTVTGKTVIFKKTAVNDAFGINVDDPTTYPEGSEYYTLRNSRSNWTFNYA